MSCAGYGVGVGDGVADGVRVGRGVFVADGVGDGVRVARGVLVAVRVGVPGRAVCVGVGVAGGAAGSPPGWLRPR